MITQLNQQQLIENWCIQGFDTNITNALFSTIAHFRGHTQEIIHLPARAIGRPLPLRFCAARPGARICRWSTDLAISRC